MSESRFDAVLPMSEDERRVYVAGVLGGIGLAAEMAGHLRADDAEFSQKVISRCFVLIRKPGGPRSNGNGGRVHEALSRS